MAGMSPIKKAAQLIAEGKPATLIIYGFIQMVIYFGIVTIIEFTVDRTEKQYYEDIPLLLVMCFVSAVALTWFTYTLFKKKN